MIKARYPRISFSLMWLAAQEELLQAIKCSNVNVFSASSLANMMRVDWLFAPGSIILWTVILSHILLLMMAFMAVKKLNVVSPEMAVSVLLMTRT